MLGSGIELFFPFFPFLFRPLPHTSHQGRNLRDGRTGIHCIGKAFRRADCFMAREKVCNRVLTLDVLAGDDVWLAGWTGLLTYIAGICVYYACGWWIDR
jgi:hypothetical protein